MSRDEGWGAWASSFFYSPAPKVDRRLDICKAIYDKGHIGKDNLPYIQYLAQHKFIDDGYTKIVFNCFDFTDEQFDCKRLLDSICDAYVFLQAEFTFDQVKMLIGKGYDLSSSTYRVRKPVSLDQYTALYDVCEKKNLQTALHGVKVNFENADLRRFPNDFVACCDPDSLKGARLSQNQFDILVTYNKSRNLSGLSLRDIDISEFIKEQDQVISFDACSLLSGSRQICMAQTSIQGAAIDIAVLAQLAENSRYHHWFEELDLAFVIRVEDGLICKYFDVSIGALLEKLSGDACRTASTLRFQTPRSAFSAQKSVLDRVAEKVKEVNGEFMSLDFFKLTPGEQFLWVTYYVHHHQDSMVARQFWGTLRELQVSRAASSDIPMCY